MRLDLVWNESLQASKHHPYAGDFWILWIAITGRRRIVTATFFYN